MSGFRFVVERPVATWMVAIAAAVFGLVSYQRLPLNLMPDLAYPTLTVRTEVEGYAPEEVESQISRPIEEALATTPGLQELESRSRAGLSDVVLEFAWGANMDEAAQTARERLQTTFLPEDASRPLILRYDPSQAPILRLGVAFAPGAAPDDRDGGLALLREVAEKTLKRDLEALDGVAAVRVRGGLSREVRVAARQDWLAARGVTIDQLAATIGAENVNLPGGSIRDGDHEYLVRTLNEVRTTEELRSLQIRRSDGVRVRIGDVATVTEATKDREVVSHLDGEDAVELEVYKSADANIVAVAQDLVRRLSPEGADPAAPGGEDRLASKLPDGVQLVILENQASFIEGSINNLRSTALQGAVLAVLVLFLFLRDLRATAIIAAAIPLSVIVTFAPMYLSGVSLNLMSLGGLALGIGMLVDNAVVVLENIQVELERGKSRREAAVLGASGVAASVTASTLTTVAVFLPITFVEGVAGQIFGDMALAVVFSLVASLVMALFFVPVLAASELSFPLDAARLTEISPAARFSSFRQLREGWASRVGWRRFLYLPYGLTRLVIRLFFEIIAAMVVFPSAALGRVAAKTGGGAGGPLVRLALGAADRFGRAYEAMASRYARWIQSMLRRPGLVLGATLAMVVVSVALSGALGQALIPELHQGRFVAELALPVGTPLSRTAELVGEVERSLRDNPEIEHLHSIIGTEQSADSRADEGEHTARLMISLVGEHDLEAREDALMEVVRVATTGAAEALAVEAPNVQMTRPSLFSFSTPMEVLLYDDDLRRLREVSDRTVETMQGLEGLADVRSSMVAGYPELQVRYDRVLLDRFGLDTGSIAARVRDGVLGKKATTLSRGDGRVDLMVRLDEGDRRSSDDLRRINVNPNLVPAIPLEAVATITEALGPSEIRRVDQRRVASVTANLAGFDMAGQAEALRDALRQAGLDGVEWELGGQNREMERSVRSLELALLLAIFLVYIIMASTFESVLHPFVILFSVPLAVVGVVPALVLTQTPVSVVVFIGAIVLAGVVVNNAIVLVDTVNTLRAEGMPRLEALAEAARMRLRPILITTTTTVLGLVPLALGIGEGAELQQPLALTVIAGLASATLLTLGVIPTVYLVLTRALEPSAPAAPEAATDAPADAAPDAPADALADADAPHPPTDAH